jgi:hypothetical protein
MLLLIVTIPARKIVGHSYERAMLWLPLYFGEGIPEDERTFGSLASVLRVEGKIVNKKDKEGVYYRGTQKRLVTDSKRRVLVTEKSYLPVKTFQTVAITPKSTAEEVKTANLSLFYPFVGSVVKRSEEVRTNNLGPKSKDKVVFTDPKNITSNYITVDQAKRETPKVPQFFGGKDNLLETLNVPVRELVAGVKEPEKVRAILVKIDALNLDDKRPDLDHLSSLVDARFADFRAIIGEQYASVEGIRELLPKKNDNKRYIDATVIAQMELEQISGKTFDGLQLGLSQDEVLGLRKSILGLTEQATAPKAPALA